MLWKMLDTRSIFAASQGGTDPKKPRGWAGRSGKAGKIKSTHQRGLESMERHRPAMTTTSRPSLMTAGRSLMSAAAGVCRHTLWWASGMRGIGRELTLTGPLPRLWQLSLTKGELEHLSCTPSLTKGSKWHSMKLHNHLALCTVPTGKSLDKRDVPVVFFEQCHCFLTKEVVAVVGFQAPPWQKGVALEKTQSIKPAKRE